MDTCSVEGCGRKYLALGFCSRHYTQFRKYGDPLARVLPERGEVADFLSRHVDHESDECLIWPFKSHYKKGYGSVYFKGKLTGAHRAMCWMAHGAPPKGCEAAHSCGNRPCVNPRHLRWTTAQANAADKLAHGTDNRGTKNACSKLDEAQVVAIYRLKGSASQSRIAEQFGVTRENVRAIHHGKTWGWLTSACVEAA